MAKEIHLKRKIFNGAAVLFTVFSGTAMAAENLFTAFLTPVGPATGAITQFNYDESGGTVTGFLVGPNVLLTFLRPVCGGIGTLGAVGNNVTYSGSGHTFASGLEVVIVTSFTNGNITYPPVPVITRPSAYPLTTGTISQLNYSPENGSVNGFVFTPSSTGGPGPTNPIPTSSVPSPLVSAGGKVFVDIGEANATLTPLLTVGATVSVMGTLEAPGACAPAGTISEVDASSLTIGSKVYPIGGNR
jgi:hypothetical protein